MKLDEITVFYAMRVIQKLKGNINTIEEIEQNKQLQAPSVLFVKLLICVNKSILKRFSFIETFQRKTCRISLFLVSAKKLLSFWYQPRQELVDHSNLAGGNGLVTLHETFDKPFLNLAEFLSENLIPGKMFFLLITTLGYITLGP